MARKSDHVLASFNAVISGDFAVNRKYVTPTDEDSLEHLHDFGGGSPPFAIA
jgi:hypothetical protein